MIDGSKVIYEQFSRWLKIWLKMNLRNGLPKATQLSSQFPHQQSLWPREKKKNPCLLSLCLATLCPRDTHLIAPLFVAPSRTSLKFVGFEEEERRLGLVPLVSISRQRRGVVYNLHQVSLSCPIISSSVSCTWLFLLLLPFNTERLPPINLYWKFNTERERERKVYLYELYL